MKTLLAIFIGGGIGSLARYGTGKLFAALMLFTFPYGTLAANTISSFLLGIFIGFSLLKPDDANSLRFLIAVGFCGGFSTFSTFSAETYEIFKNGFFLTAMMNVFLNLAACILMTATGIWIGKQLF